MLSTQYSQAAELIAQADALVIGAGAGMGVDSGLPDFRGNQGFWQAYPAFARAKLDFMEVASPSTFVQDPRLAWGFYGHRLDLYRKTVPHAGFDILRQWGKLMSRGTRIFTSNVDGQFQKAGFAEDQIHEYHGSIHHMQCTDACESGVWSAAAFTPEVDQEACRLLNELPHCPHCAGLARPNILMFDDSNWLARRTESQQERETRWLESMADSQARIVVVEMGAGSAIPSVRHFSDRLSHDYGARIIRINPREPQVPSAKDVGIAAGSLEALLEIDVAIDELLARD